MAAAWPSPAPRSFAGQLVVGDAYRNDPQVHVHLRGRQADALGLVHALQHVLRELAHAVVDLRHRSGHGVQSGIGVAKNL